MSSSEVLIGLCQASRNWYSKFAEALHRYGFKQSDADHSLFIYSQGTKYLAILVYVDDLLLVGNSSQQCSLFKKYLDGCFRIKDLDPLTYFLGIKVTKSSSGLFLNQQKYVLDILSECGMLGCRPSSFPME